MIRKKRIIFILIYSVLFLFSCGIPRMFPWDQNEEYKFDINHLNFNLYYHVQNDYDGSSNRYELEPVDDTPVLRFLYLIIPNTTASSSTLSSLYSMISSFGSSFSSGMPPSYGSGTRAYTRTYTNDAGESISVGLYELSVLTPIGDESYRVSPSSSIFKGMDYFIPVDSDSYEANYEFQRYQVDGGYFIELTLNGKQFLLARSNGEPFSNSNDDYIQDGNNDGREFLAEDADEVISTEVRIYAVASFMFKGYTTRATITSGTGSSGYITI